MKKNVMTRVRAKVNRKEKQKVSAKATISKEQIVD
jgi:hypothetical protein